MATKNFQSFNNYISVANSNKNNFALYFYIKNFCFRKMISLVSHDKNSFFPNESLIIENQLKQFKEETQTVNIPQLSKSQFCAFLEKFYSQFNFDSNEIKTFELCKDITEILSIYGPYDELAKQRMDYFTKKISILENMDMNQNIPNPKSSSQNNFIEDINYQQPKSLISISKDKKELQEDYNFANNLMTESVVTDMEHVKFKHDYLPKKINKSFNLPIVKSTPEYNKIKEEIITNIEDGICELEYFNIDHAKEYVECALYYLRNIIEKK